MFIRGDDDSFSVINKISCDEKIKPLLQALLSGAYVADGSVRGMFWISGGAEKIISNEPYWGEETRLQDSLAALADESKAIVNQKDMLQPKLAAFHKAAELANSAALKISLEIKDKENQAENARENLRLNKERIQLLAKNKERYESELRKASESAAQFEKALSELKKESESLRNKKAGLDSQKEQLHSDFALQKEAFAISRSELENFNKNLEGLNAELMRNEADFRSMEGESAHFDSRSRELELKEKKVRESSGSANIKLETLRDDLAKKEILLAQLDEEINALRLDYSRLELNLKDSRALFAETERIKIKLETEMTSQQARGEETKQRLADAWEISVEEAEKNYSGQEADHERIVFLRRRAEAMGPVNMTAPEEHEALSQRYDFINSQAEDLKKAKSDLHSAIAKINDATRESFSITFDKVRSYFKEIYSLLFNGGESDLVLTDPDNLLETGIEIIARPPGKRPVSITQLSGGEKALTALSLLFSFFRVSPSPFCVMDETDAPLDEANVERFVKLIREFAPATQFLVITHNKRTMEAAETLYGVTMEEVEERDEYDFFKGLPSIITEQEFYRMCVALDLQFEGSFSSGKEICDFDSLSSIDEELSEMLFDACGFLDDHKLESTQGNVIFQKIDNTIDSLLYDHLHENFTSTQGLSPFSLMAKILQEAMYLGFSQPFIDVEFDDEVLFGDCYETGFHAFGHPLINYEK